jgi:hypothetical protein
MAETLYFSMPSKANNPLQVSSAFFTLSDRPALEM